jgi:hypothetical protein
MSRRPLHSAATQPVAPVPGGRRITPAATTAGGARQPPQFVSHTLGSGGWSSSAHPKTASVAVVAGDRIQVFGVSEDQNTTISTPGDGGVNTYVLRQSNLIAGTCGTYYWNATAATTTTLTISVDSGGGANAYCFAVLVWRGSDGFGVSGKNDDTAATMVLSLTTGQANSAVVCYGGDWTATDGASRAWLSIGAQTVAEDEYALFAGHYTVYGGHWLDCASAGPKTLGLTGPAGQTFTVVGGEVLGKAAGGDQDVVVSDTVGMTDTGLTQVVVTTDTFDDLMGLTDSTAVEVSKVVTDTMGLTDATVVVLTGGGTTHTRTVDDTMGLTDTTVVTVGVGGRTAAGGATRGAAAKVAPVVGRAAAGAFSRVAGARVAPVVGRTTAAPSTRATPTGHLGAAAATTAAAVTTRAAPSNHSAVRTGTAAAAVVARASDAKVAPVVGRAAVGVVSRATPSNHSAARTATLSVAVAARGAAVHVSPQVAGSATTPAAVATNGVVSSSSAVPETGRGVAAFAATAQDPAKTALPAAATLAATSSRGVAARVAPVAGRTAAGVATRATPSNHSAARTAVVAGGVAARAVASNHSAARTGLTTAATSSRGVAAHLSPQPAGSARGVAAVATYSGGGRTASPTGRTTLAPAALATHTTVRDRAATTTLAPAARATAGTLRDRAATTTAGASSRGLYTGLHRPGGSAAAGTSSRGMPTHLGASPAGTTTVGAATWGLLTPPPPVNPPLYDAAAAVLACAAAALANTPAGPPTRACVVPGVLAFDACECGLLAVEMGRLYPSRTFPADASQDPALLNCPTPYEAADLTVTVLRCAPMPDGSGAAPSCDRLHAAAGDWWADVAALRAALACCLPQLVDDQVVLGFVLRPAQPVGPQGGCIGWAQPITVALCPPPCPAGAA